MASIDARFPMSHVMQRVTMHVRITDRRRFAVRTWVAIQLMRLAARVLGCNIDVNIEQKQNEPAF